MNTIGYPRKCRFIDEQHTKDCLFCKEVMFCEFDFPIIIKTTSFFSSFFNHAFGLLKYQSSGQFRVLFVQFLQVMTFATTYIYQKDCIVIYPSTINQTCLNGIEVTIHPTGSSRPVPSHMVLKLR